MSMLIMATVLSSGKTGSLHVAGRADQSLFFAGEGDEDEPPRQLFRAAGQSRRASSSRLTVPEALSSAPL